MSSTGSKRRKKRSSHRAAVERLAAAVSGADARAEDPMDMEDGVGSENYVYASKQRKNRRRHDGNDDDDESSDSDVNDAVSGDESSSEEEEEEEDAAARARTLRAQADMEEVARAYQGKVVSRRDLGSDDSGSDEAVDVDDAGEGNGDVDDDEDSDAQVTFGDTWGDQASADDESDDDDDDDDEQAAPGGAEAGVLAALQRLQKEDSVALMSRRATDGDAAKARAVRHQRSLWESVMDLRIRLQKPVREAARLPRPETLPAFAEHGGKKLRKAREAVRASTHGLLGDLVDLQHEMSAMHPAMPDLERGAHSLDGVKPGDTDAVWARLEAVRRAQEPRINAVIDKWNRKTQLASGKSALASRSFKAVNQSVLSQIRGIMEDEERLLKRSRLVRSDYRVLGRAARDEQAGDGEARELDGRREEYDEEVYDDGDFYQHLLRDIISSGAAAGGDTESELLANARRARKRKRAAVDRRASKGRKLRYTVEPKLVNFTTPAPRDTTDLLVDELFAGLFGGQKRQ